MSPRTSLSAETSGPCLSCVRILRTESDGRVVDALPCVAPAIGRDALLIAGAAWMTSVCALFNVTEEALGTVQSVSFLVSGSQSFCRWGAGCGLRFEVLWPEMIPINIGLSKLFV